jgi:nitrite reductase (NADH) small subunit
MWQDICNLDDLDPDAGVCALVEKEQVAIFRIGDGDRIYAIDNLDPKSGAQVLSRGLIGSEDGKVFVASPLYKNRFFLESGLCPALDLKVRTWEIRVRDGRVELRH